MAFAGQSSQVQGPLQTEEHCRNVRGEVLRRLFSHGYRLSPHQCQSLMPLHLLVLLLVGEERKTLSPFFCHSFGKTAAADRIIVSSHLIG